MSALEHVAQGRVQWLEAKTHDNVSICIVNSAYIRLQLQVTHLLSETIESSQTQLRIMGGDFNTALARYAKSAGAIHDKVDKFFQALVHSTRDNRADPASAVTTPPVADAAISSMILSGAANP